MSNETVVIPISLFDEMAAAFKDGGLVLGDTINVFDQMTQAFSGENIQADDVAEMSRLNREVVTPLLQSVEMRFNLLEQKLERTRNGEAMDPPRIADMAEALTNGEATINSVLEVLRGLEEGLRNEELQGVDARDLAQICRETHVPALEGTTAQFLETRQAITSVNGEAGTNTTLWTKLANTYAQGHENLKQTTKFLQAVADKLSASDLTGEEAGDLESLLHNPLLPAMVAVTDKLGMLQLDAESAINVLGS